MYTTHTVIFLFFFSVLGIIWVISRWCKYKQNYENFYRNIFVNMRIPFLLVRHLQLQLLSHRWEYV